MKNDEYINEELEGSTLETEDTLDKSDKEITKESLPDSESSLSGEDGSADLQDEQKLYDGDVSEALADEPTLFDGGDAEALADEPTLFDDADAEAPADELTLLDEGELLDDTSLFDNEDTETASEDVTDENDDAPDTEASDEDLTDDLADESEDETSEDEGQNESEDTPSPDENKPEEEEEKPRRVDNLFDFIELFVFTLAAVFIITSFFFRYSIVDGGSMQNTLQDDEALILRSIFYTPECGDVVVVQDKSTVLKDPIVKRVIALGGQTVRFTRDAVYVDGVKLDEPYVYTGDYDNPFGGEDIYRYSVYPSDALLPIVTDREDGVFYEITVPEGEIFVMGDHRNLSKDSRDIGTIHEDAVIGKVVLRFLPFEKFGKIE